MEYQLALFSEIAEHLINLTTFDSYRIARSRGVGDYEALAEELNDIGILPKRGKWTPHALECFFSRCRKRYSLAELHSNCDDSKVGTICWDYHPTKTLSSLADNASPSVQEKRVEAIASAPEQSESVETGVAERWYRRELPELDREAASLIRQARALAKKQKNSKKFERI